MAKNISIYLDNTTFEDFQRLKTALGTGDYRTAILCFNEGMARLLDDVNKGPEKYEESKEPEEKPGVLRRLSA